MLKNNALTELSLPWASQSIAEARESSLLGLEVWLYVI